MSDTRTGFEKFEDILREAEADAMGKEQPKAKRAPIRFVNFTDPDPDTVEPRDWLYDLHYIRKFLSADIAPGGTVKTSAALVEALAMASSADLLGAGDDRMPPRPLRVVYWTGEDTLDEIVRREAAAVKHYWGLRADAAKRAAAKAKAQEAADEADGFEDRGMKSVHAQDDVLEDEASRALLRTNLFLASGRDLPIKIVTGGDRGFKIAVPLVDEMVRALTEQRIDVFQADPFIDTYEGISENDNAAIQACAAQWRLISERADCSVNLSHHSRKPRAGGSKEIDSDDSRGASALVAACRSVRVYNVLDEKEAPEHGISPADRFQYVEVGNGKPNMVKRSSFTAWRRIISVTLGNDRDARDGETRGRPQDSVGVVVTWAPPIKTKEEAETNAARILATLLDVLASGKRITRQQGGDYTIKDCVAILRRKDINATVDQIREALDAACDGADAVLEYYRRGGEATYRRRAKVEE